MKHINIGKEKSAYFWNREKGKKLKSIIQNLDDIKKVFVSVAFCSKQGAEFLISLIDKNKINKDNVTIILNKKFSNRSCSYILQKLNEKSNVFINTEDGFHPKFYLFTKNKEESFLISGSNNLTTGGLETNLEFAQITILNPNSEIIIGFKAVSQNKTLQVTDDIIRLYESIEEKIKEINNSSYGINSLINQTLGLNTKFEPDPIKKENYNFNNQLFVFEDYELFFSRNASSDNHDIILKRESVQNKLVGLLDKIESHIQNKKYDLHRHWSPIHITSLTKPLPYNNWKVEWLGVRLGKKQDEIKLFQEGFDHGYTNDYGFQKHACFQYSLFSYYFWIGIFHAVPNNAIDRMYMTERIKDKDFCNKLIELLEKMENKDYCWNIGDKSFAFKTDNSRNFINYYKKHEQHGVDSMLGKFFRCDDEKINKKNIIQTINATIDDLYNICKRSINHTLRNG